MAMAEIVLRVRLIGGEHLDVTYEQDASTPEEMVDQVISALAEDNGLLRCRHGGRLIVLYGRGRDLAAITCQGAGSSRIRESAALVRRRLHFDSERIGVTTVGQRSCPGRQPRLRRADPGLSRMAPVRAVRHGLPAEPGSGADRSSKATTAGKPARSSAPYDDAPRWLRLSIVRRARFPFMAPDPR